MKIGPPNLSNRIQQKVADTAMHLVNPTILKAETPEEKMLLIQKVKVRHFFDTLSATIMKPIEKLIDKVTNK